jgi:hypothetical protein
MKNNSQTRLVAALLLVVFFAGSVLALLKVESARGSQATLEEVLYLPSGKMLKRLSLGYSSLLADIYWTRAVQYFGARHQLHSMRYDLLYPLLDITTDLDPHIIVAYEYGSIFLSQQPPNGAGEPDKAVSLIEKGIRENPQHWRLYFTLGFVHYIDRHDPKAAQQAFERGAQIPGALPWMKVMAARMAERGRDINTAFALWRAVEETTPDKDVKTTARLHLVSMRADMELRELQRRVNLYRQRVGRLPANWSELEQAALLRGTPRDPNGEPYKLNADGTVEVRDSSKYPYLGEWRSNEESPK